MRRYAPADSAAAAANSAPAELPAGCWEEERKGMEREEGKEGEKRNGSEMEKGGERERRNGTEGSEGGGRERKWRIVVHW